MNRVTLNRRATCYRIERVGAPNVYKENRTEMIAWHHRNEGEGQSSDEVNALEELNRLADQVYELQQELLKHAGPEQDGDPDTDPGPV